MADRTVNKIYVSGGMDRLPVPIANGVTLPVGTLAQWESGFANHWDGTNPLIGIVLGGENTNTANAPVGDTSQSPDPAAYIDASGLVIRNIPVTGSTVQGVYVYCDDSDLDNATVTQPGTDAPIGYIVGFRSATDCDVKLFPPDVHILGSDAAAFAAWV